MLIRSGLKKLSRIHYGCALRCVASDSHTTQRAAIMEISLQTDRLQCEPLKERVVVYMYVQW